MQDYQWYANIKPPKAREKAIKILFVRQIISLFLGHGIPVRNLDPIMHSFCIVIVKFFCVREGNALQVAGFEEFKGS